MLENIFSPSPENDSTPVREIADLRERFIVEIKTQYNFKFNWIQPNSSYCSFKKDIENHILLWSLQSVVKTSHRRWHK